jgi:predicted transcriptional regulator
MIYDHDIMKRKRPSRVAEPVQVYLDASERARLERLAERLATTKSDVLRRAIAALEGVVSDPARHPALRVIGLAEREVSGPVTYDVAVEHDRFLAERTEPHAS